MILTIDVGNTNVVLGIFEAGKLSADFRIATDKFKTEDEYGMLVIELFKFHSIKMEIEGAIISSVVPNIVPVMIDMCRKYFKCEPMIVGPGMKTGLEIKYENPKEVGADRIVNAVAAREIYKSNLIIVDFGTATTFCVVTKDGDYLGGAIAPGIVISSDALFSRAAKLPRVEVTRPTSIIGRNTISSMQSGIYYGFVGQVDEIVSRMKSEMIALLKAANKDSSCPKVIATGGLSTLISSDSKEIDYVEEFLTLYGLKILYEKNV